MWSNVTVKNEGGIPMWSNVTSKLLRNKWEQWINSKNSTGEVVVCSPMGRLKI
jgi:hypothetical protein